LDIISDINWDEVWQKQMRPIADQGEGAAYWDKRAQKKSVTHDNYAQELLKRIEVSSSDSVLDAGCGNGWVTVPLAKLARRVTALDISPVSLTVLQKAAEQAGITNITPLTGDFPALYRNGGLKSHDIVIASRSLPMGNLKTSLAAMNALAVKRCYLTWTSGESELIKNVCALSGQKYSPFPEYPLILNLLYSMGIHAGLELFFVEGSRNYTSIDDALNETMHRYAITDKEVLKKIKDYIATQLIEENGKYRLDTKSEWALIRWQNKQGDCK
jgi:SAM-dependent methyltransferase